jgi:hypothetical protein
MKRQPEKPAECDMCVGNRQLLEAIRAEIAEMKTTPRINVATLRPDDVLVFSTERHLSDAEFTDIDDRIKASPLGDVPRVLLEDGMTVRVVRPEVPE